MAHESDRDNADDLAALVATFRAAAREFAPTSPLYARLATGVADDDDVLALVAATPPAQRRATLLMAAVRDLLLAEPPQPLAAWYPDLARGTVATGDPYPAFRAFCRARCDELALLLATRATQTNEVGRCAGLLPAFGVVARLAADRPLALLEVGASAGLNLRFDRYAYDYGAGRVAGDPGAAVLLSCTVRGPVPPPIPTVMPPIASRLGLDLAPLDVRADADARWLRACIWPESRVRLSTLERALADARADPPALVTGDAVAALPALIATIPRDTPLCVFHTATLAYFTREDRARFADVLAALAVDRDMYWLSGEGPGPLHAAARPAAMAWRHADEAARVAGTNPPSLPHWLVLTTWRDGYTRERLLAGMDPHGTWLEWCDPPTA